MTIWKYPLVLTDGQAVDIPTGGTILHVGEQHGVICWHVFEEAP